VNSSVFILTFEGKRRFVGPLELALALDVRRADPVRIVVTVPRAETKQNKIAL